MEKWVEDYGRHNGRLKFFAGFNPTPFVTTVANPLLSMKTTGSISVERAAKPLKNKLATKERNIMSTETMSTLLRVGLNLRLKAEHLKKAEHQLQEPHRELVYDSLLG